MGGTGFFPFSGVLLSRPGVGARPARGLGVAGWAQTQPREWRVCPRAGCRAVTNATLICLTGVMRLFHTGALEGDEIGLPDLSLS